MNKIKKLLFFELNLLLSLTTIALMLLLLFMAPIRKNAACTDIHPNTDCQNCVCYTGGNFLGNPLTHQIRVFPLPSAVTGFPIDVTCVDSVLTVPNWDFDGSKHTGMHPLNVVAIFKGLPGDPGGGIPPTIEISNFITDLHGHRDAFDTVGDFLNAGLFNLNPIAPLNNPLLFNVPVPRASCEHLPDPETVNSNPILKAAFQLLVAGNAFIQPDYDSDYLAFDAASDSYFATNFYEELVFNLLGLSPTQSLAEGCSQGGYVGLQVSARKLPLFQRYPAYLPMDTYDAVVAEAISTQAAPGPNHANAIQMIRTSFDLIFDPFFQSVGLASAWQNCWSSPEALSLGYPEVIPRYAFDQSTWDVRIGLNPTPPPPFVVTSINGSDPNSYPFQCNFFNFPVDFEFEVEPLLDFARGFVPNVKQYLLNNLTLANALGIDPTDPNHDPSPAIGDAMFMKQCFDQGYLTAADLPLIAGWELLRRLNGLDLPRFYKREGLAGLYFGTEAWGEAVRWFKRHGVDDPNCLADLGQHEQVILKREDEKYFESLSTPTLDFQGQAQATVDTINVALFSRRDPIRAACEASPDGGTLRTLLELDAHGPLQIPTLAMWTPVDHQVYRWNADIIEKNVKKAGSKDKFLLLEATPPSRLTAGHCDFDAAQQLAAFQAALQWAATGIKPGVEILTKELGFEKMNPPKYPYKTKDKSWHERVKNVK